MSSLNDTLSILNVEQLNNAVSLAHVLPLQPDGNQTNHLMLPSIQNTSHAMSAPASLPMITVTTTIPTNTINSGPLPILMQLNSIPQANPNLSQTINNTIRQITIPVLQEQHSHVLLPMQNVTPASLEPCTIQPNMLTAVNTTDVTLQALLSTPNQLSTLNLNQVIDHRMSDVANRLIQPNDNMYQNRMIQPNVNVIQNRMIQPNDNVIQNRMIQPNDVIQNRILQPNDVIQNRIIQPNDVIQNRMIQANDMIQPNDNMIENRMIRPNDVIQNRIVQPIGAIQNRIIQPNDNAIQNRIIQPNDAIQNHIINDNHQVLTSLPVTMTTPQPVLTTVNQSGSIPSKSTTLNHNGRTYLLNLPIDIQNNQPITINSAPPVQPTTVMASATIGQQLQMSLPDMHNQAIEKSNISSLTSTGLNELNFATQDVEPGHDDGTQPDVITVRDPVAAASLFAGVTDDIENNSITMDNEFDTSLWCVECNASHPLTCPARGDLHCIPDSPILSHARQTLPSVLQIKSSTVTANVDGVFAKGVIVARSQFGPLKGSVVKEPDPSTDLEYPNLWKIFHGDDLHHCIQASDEKMCNWMMFVRNARMSSEQNIVAYQWGQCIFFTTTRAVDPGEELLYWYSGTYAKKKGLKDRPEQCFWCTKCERQFLSATKLNRHMKYSHPDMSDRKFKCTHCSRAFLCLTKLNVHLMTHSNVKPHKCLKCDKTFTDPSNLRMHQLIHSNVKKFKCQQCARAFRQKAHLVTHMVTHTGEKKLKCPQCDKLFSRQSDVKTHMYFHTKEKQAKCSLCFKEFWNPQQYRKHMKSHEQEREYNCSFCKRGFSSLTHFKRHQESAVCQKNDVLSSTEKPQEANSPENRRRGRPKARKRNKDSTPRLIAPAIDPPIMSQVSVLEASYNEELSAIQEDNTIQPISAVSISTEQFDSSSAWIKRSTRISQRRKQGKVINYTEERS